MNAESFLRLFQLLKQAVINRAQSDVYYTQTTNYVAFMGYTILLWDHFISVGDEVQYIWMRPKSPAVYLFFLNRYFTPLAFIGNLVAYFSHWPKENFVKYEGSCTVIALEVAAIMMFLRVWALYRDHKLILSSVIALFLLETGVHAWLMVGAQAVDHPFTVKACTMIFSTALGGWPSLSAWLPLIFDTYATILTLCKCMPRVRTSSPAYIFRVLLRDGLIYYSVIFLVNLILAIMILAAPNPIKNIAAQLEQLLTVSMISRITLSLRRSAYRRTSGFVSSEDDGHQYELDGWHAAVREHQHWRTNRSSTVCQHISVITRSDVSPSDSPFMSPIESMHGADVDKSIRRSWFHVEPGTNSIGVLSISPAHSHEAAAAAVITDPSMMSDRDVFELRVMRPVPSSTSTNRLRI